ncbi:prepilin-type N-terminal cleavage/methylation domain-containing protein [Patescibacteria group bacterium]|nr:prepilin-type N-terminal cleavage/methylation domain-containing protein [Patescibacteria group bacterium]
MEITNFKLQEPKRAFTLIETMIAVAILTLAVAGPLFTASRAIVAAATARDQLTASYLAQEGVEYVRAVRDNAYLAAYGGANASSVAWSSFLSTMSSCNATSNSAVACALDPVARGMGVGSGFSLQPCTIGACAPLYLANNGTTNYYTTNPNASNLIPTTSFTRTVQVFDASAADERVVSTVSWSYHEIPYSVTVYDHLTPWQ